MFYTETNYRLAFLSKHNLDLCKYRLYAKFRWDFMLRYRGPKVLLRNHIIIVGSENNGEETHNSRVL